MKTVFVALLSGVLLGGILVYVMGFSREPDSQLKPGAGEQGASSREPLYWVAPMDANYRRDKPGKSPMGMDLVPVYDEGRGENAFGPGTVEVDPRVVNNLGVRTTRVIKKPLTQEIRTVGFIKYDESRLIHIHPRVSGWIDKLYVKATGDPVKKGAPLYALYSPELVGAQEDFILALNSNSGRLIKSAKDRLDALKIPDYFVDKLKLSRMVQQTVTFYSPQDGVVENLHIREGFYVQPGTELFSIANMDEVWVEAEVFERQAASLNAVAKATMTLDFFPGEQWQGNIDYIYPTVNEHTRTLRVRLKFKNSERRLLPNMHANVVIHSEHNTPSLLIPSQALIRTGRQQRVVLALGEGRFKSIAVTVGQETERHIEILDGLDEGDEVVVSAQFLLDSESSKASDFLRMAEITHSDDSIQHVESDQSATASGVINSVNNESRTLNISRGPIEKWQRPAATMDFELAETVSIADLKPKQEIEFRFEIRQGRFVVVDMAVLDTKVLQHERQHQHQKINAEVAP